MILISYQYVELYTLVKNPHISKWLFFYFSPMNIKTKKKKYKHGLDLSQLKLTMNGVFSSSRKLLTIPSLVILIVSVCPLSWPQVLR